MAFVAALRTSRPSYLYPFPRRHHNEGNGRRLTAAFDALEAYPMHVEARNRVLALFAAGQPSTAELVAAVEADVALALTLMRQANRLGEHTRGRIDSAVAAVEVLPPATVLQIAQQAQTFDFFERSSIWPGIPDRFRLHAITAQRAAELLAGELDYEARDRLMITSLLHDIGKLVLVQAYPGYPRQIHREARTPEERIANERRDLGVDHALVGGVVARRWGLPSSVASVIDRHHLETSDGEAAVVRLADMLAHYVLGSSISPAEMLSMARAIGLKPAELRTVLYDLPQPSARRRPRQVDPCPMSAREVEVLRRLAKGMVYKQIASELGLSTSTVRTHLHNVYGKLGAMDRAQAVLIATARGWI